MRSTLVETGMFEATIGGRNWRSIPPWPTNKHHTKQTTHKKTPRGSEIQIKFLAYYPYVGHAQNA